MKKCPFCAEEIQDDAIKCRFCNEMLAPRQKASWLYSNSFLAVSFVFLGPLWPVILPLVWLNPRFSRIVKIILSVVILVLSWYMGKVFLQAMDSLKQYYNLMGG